MPGGRNRPRIALVAPLAFVERTGIARYQDELVGHLAGRLDLDLLVQERLVGRLRAKGLPEPLTKVRLHDYYSPGVAARHAPSFLFGLASRPYLWDLQPETFLSLVASRLLAGEAADATGADLVHGTQNWLPETRRARVRVVTIHDTIPLTRPEEVTRTTRRAFLRPRELRPTDFVFANSKATLDDLRAVFDVPDERAVVYYPGIDHALFRPPGPGEWEPAGGPPYLLSVGMSEPRKNFPRALAAFEALRRSHPSLQWKVVTGRGFGRAALDQALARSPARGQVEVLTGISDADLQRLYWGAACVLNPSLAEGFGLPVVEALACGTPLAASDLPAHREGGGDAFVALDPTDVGSIVEAAERAAFDEAGRSARRDRGVQAAGRFTWAATAETHLDGYAKALGVERGELTAPP